MSRWAFCSATMWLQGVKKSDLDSEITSVAKTELAKMNPVFAH